MARLQIRTYVILTAWFVTSGVVYVLMIQKGVAPAAEDPATAAAVLKLAYYESLLAEKNAQIASLKKRALCVLSASRGDTFSTSNDSAVNCTARNSGNVEVYPELSIYTVLPHLNGSRELLGPYRSTGHVKEWATIVLGVPHIRRSRTEYLLQTLESLVTNMDSSDWEDTLIVVQVSEPWNVSYYDAVCEQVLAKFREHVTSGLIEVILPPAGFYPDFGAVPMKWGDSKERTRWRTKQNLDYAFLMMYGARYGIYYVQLEDDIVAKNKYLSTILSFARTQKNWQMLEFCQLGFIGKCFRSEMVTLLVEFILLFYEQKPVDLLLFNYFILKECYSAECPTMAQAVRKFKPSLFQHIGYHSSLVGKVQDLQDSSFKETPVAATNSDPKPIGHSNPAATLATSLKQHQEFSLDGCYNGVTVFWALNPQPGDTITFTFVSSVPILRYRLVSGDEQHPQDRFHAASVEVLPSNVTTAAATWHGDVTEDKFFVINTFNEAFLIDDVVYSVAEGNVPGELGSLTALRVTFHEESQNWAILKEVHMQVSE